uniref:Uncharacterized protein n=1 Tax=Arundo donax TaxID=35708 RepID=A0A0A9BF20_ARUDO
MGVARGVRRIPTPARMEGTSLHHATGRIDGFLPATVYSAAGVI